MRDSFIKMAKELNLILLPNDEIKTGDLYLAERNNGVKLLECSVNNKEIKCIVPTTPDYAYDTHECCKVVENDRTR